LGTKEDCPLVVVDAMNEMTPFREIGAHFGTNQSRGTCDKNFHYMNKPGLIETGNEKLKLNI
jgi:hypothetical protein